MSYSPPIFFSFINWKKYDNAYELLIQVLARTFTFQLMIIKVIPLAVSISELMLIEVIALDEGDVGIFAAIISLLVFVWLSYKALFASIAPKISPAIKLGHVDELKKVLIKSSWYHIAVSAVITVLIVVFAKPLLQFFGSAYVKGVVPLIIMALGDFVANSFRASEMVLQYGGYPKIVSKIVVFSFCFGVTLTAILISQYGLLGAAIGYVVTRLIQSLVSTFWCVRVLRILPISNL